MIRGAIDLVRDDQVGGWLYSPLREFKEHIVLAFLDEQCVGSGRIRLVREDLKAAGFGDGLCGFNFAISVPNAEDLPRVVVKMEGSDLMLLQPGAAVGKSDLYQPVFASLERLEWLRKKGMLDPADFTFLKYIQQMSVFDYSLVAPKAQAAARSDMLDPVAAAQTLFELLALRPVTVKELSGSPQSQEELSLVVLSSNRTPLPIVALHSRTPGVIAVVEGSHSEDPPDGGFDGAVDYPFGPDRLLFLHLNARFRFLEGRTPALRILIAV